MKHATLTLKLAIACALAACCTLAAAQPGASADELLQDADHVLQQLDSNHYAELWQQAAPFVRAKLPRDQFVSSMREARQALGAVSSRGWASVTRIRYTNSGNVPDGLYANVDFATTLADGRTQFELLSFQLDDGGHWRFTGYVPRQSQGATSSTPAPVEP